MGTIDVTKKIWIFLALLTMHMNIFSQNKTFKNNNILHELFDKNIES